jgi:hypothetical protein
MGWRPALTPTLPLTDPSGPNFPGVFEDRNAYLKTSCTSWQMGSLELASDVEMRPRRFGVALTTRVRRDVSVANHSESRFQVHET